MDLQKSATQPQFGDVYKQIQTQYGEKPVKPREIKKTLGKDDFLKIMITQMKNQDPTNPFKAEQMAAEIAQFTSVEQLQNVNQNLNKMSSQNRPIEQMAMTHLIGKTVTIDRQRFPHTENEADSLSFNLPKKAKEVTLTVVNEVGEEIFKKDLGSQDTGTVNFSWDGIRSNGLPAKTGNFMLKVDAKDEKSIPIEIDSVAKAKIIGVSFEGSEAVFLVGNATHQEKITMRNIVRVEMDDEQISRSGNSGIKPLENSNINKNNFISFQKGVGSTNLDLEKTKTLEQVMNQAMKPAENPLVNTEKNLAINPTVNPMVNSVTSALVSPTVIQEEKGFPNGLTSLGEKNE